MRVTTERYGDTVVARPEGRIDHTVAAEFEAELLRLVGETADRAGTVVIDASGFEYISSVGLRALMIAAKQLQARRAPLLLAAPQPLVAEILRISRFDRVLTLTATLDEALARTTPQALADWRAAAGAARP